MPDFYRRLASEPVAGAVLDLPHGGPLHNDYVSAYMYYQTIHRHPIAWSYLSRNYARVSVAGFDGLWQPDAPAGPALRARLRELGYRHVVVHRYPAIFRDGSVGARPARSAVECADGGRGRSG